MIRFTLIILPAVIALAACAPEKPSIEYTSKPVISLQIINVIEPSIGSSLPLSGPRDVAVNMLGDIYIADYGNDRIVKLDSAYNFVDEIGGFGVSDYSLNGPSALALDNVSNLYVIDSGNKRILRFDRNCNFVSRANGFTKNENVDFINPTGLEVSPRGEIFIGDEGLGACFKLDQFFDYIYDFGEYSVRYPADIAFSRDDKVYVADSEFGKIFVFDDFGLHIKTIGDEILRKPSAVAVSPQSGIWVVDSEAGMLYCFNFRGDEIFRWNGEGNHRLENPAGLFIDSDGTIYIVDSAYSRIIIAKPVFGK